MQPTIVFQTTSSIALVVLGLVLFARKLPRRSNAPLRAVVMGVAIVAITVAAIVGGFTAYPSLTDDLSFVTAIFPFTAIIALEVACVLFIWDVPLLTALFCASSAYTLQNLALGIDRTLHVYGLVKGSYPALGMPEVISLWGSALVAYVICDRVLVTRLERDGMLHIANPLMSLALVSAILFNIIFDLIIKDIVMFEIPHRYVTMLSLLHIIICAGLLAAEFELLYNHRLRNDIETMENVLAERQRQFEISKETIAAVNARMHDMRHAVLNSLTTGNDRISGETLRDVAREITIYDQALRTGNEALDTILTEKGLLCHSQGITLTCIADGSALSFMSTADIYTLFGSILDGAIRDIDAQESDTESKRSISLVIKKTMGMVSAHEEHWRTRDVTTHEHARLQFLRMKQIVEYYGGTISAAAHSGAAQMDILLPLEQDEE